MNETGQTLLSLRDVRRTYGTAASPDAEWVLDGVSLEMRRGESLSILGPSGSGKSSLLNVVGGIDRPTSGQVLLDGTDLGKLDDDGLSAVRREKIGFTFQFHYLLPQCTVIENVLIPVLAGGADRERMAARRARAGELLDRVGVGHRLNHRPSELSGGEKQRVAVVRALINEPALLLADEPTGSLDRTNARNLGDLLIELNREQGVALIVVTHDRTFAERLQRVFTLENGKLRPSGATAHPS
jgi:ABC-type lipoprotein export system ATPase subunit